MIQIKFLDHPSNSDIIVLLPRRPHFFSNMPIVIKIRNNMIMKANEMKKSFISIICNTKKSESTQHLNMVFCCRGERNFLCFILNYIHLFLFAFQPTVICFKLVSFSNFFCTANCVLNIFTVFFDYFWHTISKWFLYEIFIARARQPEMLQWQ